MPEDRQLLVRRPGRDRVVDDVGDRVAREALVPRRPRAVRAPLCGRARKRFDRVADAHAARRVDLAEDAEVDVLAVVVARAAIRLDLAQRVEVGNAGVRVLRRDRAASDLLVQADHRLADAHAPAEPRVLLVRLAAGDADQHAETTRVDAVRAHLSRERVQRRVGEHRHRAEAAVDAGAGRVAATSRSGAPA